MIDWDQVLNLEQESFSKGYEDGRSQAIEAGQNDGYKVGVKIGMEKYIPLGIMQSRTRHLKSTPEATNLPSLKSLETLIETGEVKNTPDEIQAFERRYKLAKTKARILTSKLKTEPINFHENVLGLTKRASDSSNIEDMY